jgi:glycerate 2-kinase
MKFLLAPNAFHGSLSAPHVAHALAIGIRRVLPHAHIVQLPVADGGDGTLDVLLHATHGTRYQAIVQDPLGKPIMADYGILGDGITGVVEMALASGTRLIPREQRNPLRASTFGTGQLIQACLDKGCKRILVGMGGSATVDGGMGMAQALGAQFLDREGIHQHVLGGVQAINLTQLDSRLQTTPIIGISDVDNILLGEQGGVRVFSPQKGANEAMVAQLERDMAQFADVVFRFTGRDVRHEAKTGAAGGLGFGLRAFFHAELRGGVQTILDMLDIDAHLGDTDWVFTGEGKLDGQTLFGKAPMGVAKRAQARGVKVVGFAGWLTRDAHALLQHGFTALMPIAPHPMTLDEAMAHTAQHLADTAERVVRLLQAG